MKIALKILAITIPVISILSNIEENREGINNLYALGSLIVIVILFKYGVRSVKRKKVLGWIMIAAAIALFFYTDSKSSLFYSIMVGTVEALFVLLPIASIFLLAVPLLSIFLD